MLVVVKFNLKLISSLEATHCNRKKGREKTMRLHHYPELLWFVNLDAQYVLSECC